MGFHIDRTTVRFLRVSRKLSIGAQGTNCFSALANPLMRSSINGCELTSYSWSFADQGTVGGSRYSCAYMFPGPDIAYKGASLPVLSPAVVVAL
jgi:hypothetical protein